MVIIIIITTIFHLINSLNNIYDIIKIISIQKNHIKCVKILINNSLYSISFVVYKNYVNRDI